MKEHFTISLPASTNYSGAINIIILLVISGLIVYPVLGFGKPESILSTFLLFLILYVIFSSMTTQNLSNELPSTLYPYNPSMGLDGISLSSYVAGMDSKQYI